MNWYHERNWRPLSGAAVIGLLVFGLSLQVAPADSGDNLASTGNAALADGSAGASAPQSTRQREPLSAPLQPEAAERQREQDGDTVEAVETRVHFVKVISSSPVSSTGGAAAATARGGLGLGAPCSCDQDCDPDLGDQCNLVQCIVRGVCSGDNTTPCSTAQAGGSADADCTENDNGTCQANTFQQRCDVVPLFGWSCESGNGFCIEDRCETDPNNPGENSICVPQGTGLLIQGPLSPCPKQCVEGAAAGLRCNRSSQCPQGDCIITGGGQCNETADECYVAASADPDTAVGRCCEADGSCTETTKTICEAEPIEGVWLRYTDPEQQEGDGNCICPKYGSGVAPKGAEVGQPIGFVRPSGLVCTGGSAAADLLGLAPVYCEDMDGDGVAPQYCLNRCVGGDNVNALCEQDNPDCSRLGTCSVGGTICVVANAGSDCGICSESGGGCDGTAIQSCPGGPTDICEFDVVQTCPPLLPGTCQLDTCATNTIEGGCEDGFIQIGDDYSLSNGSYLRLTQFRFRGGIENQQEDIIFEIWDETGTILVDTLQVEIQTGGVAAPTTDLPLTGIRDWTIEVDCWPSCDPSQLEVPQPNPVIIPPRGYVVLRSARTIGTLNGAAASWSQTDADDQGLNDNTKSWVNGNPNASLGTNVYIFELVGVKVPAPIGACCDQGGSACSNTLRWECGLCSPDGVVGCASTLLDCPDGGLTGSVCQFNKWFGPISHSDFEFGALDITLCDENDPFLAPCNLGGCCQGGPDGFCTVELEDDCNDIVDAIWLGPATDCDPDCCPKTPIGVDCICETWNCVITDSGIIPGFVCDPNDIGGFCHDGNGDPVEPATECDTGNGDTDCTEINEAWTCEQHDGGCDPGQTCEFSCAPDPAHITELRHPYECIDDVGSPLEPPIPCNPVEPTDCPPILCTMDSDCPLGISCDLGFCEDTLAMTCEQSFTTSFTVSKTDTIDSFFGVLDGDACSLNTTSDRVGWFERFTLVDPTPGGTTADNCFVLTVSLCCTDPVLTPVWAFLSQFLECPCFEFSDVFGIPPDIDLGNNLLSGFGPASLSHFPCEDENYAGTWTVPPGDYAYQIRAGRICQGVIPTVACEDDAECPGACVVGTPDYTVHFTVESCNIGACCVAETCIETNRLDCLEQQGNFLGDGDQPVVTCQAGACLLGSCCLDGACKDSTTNPVLDTKVACEGAEGEYFGGVACDESPCPACPFHFPQNCQQVQTIFGLVPSIDRNPENGPDDMTALVLADDLKFGGSEVNTICWNASFFLSPCCQNGCAPESNIDDGWEVRIYEADPTCSAIPGIEVNGIGNGRSTIEVLNKIEGTGQGTATWLYSGKLTTPIGLPNGGAQGDTYWMEVSVLGETECGVSATHSRDHGNNHHAVSTWPAGVEPNEHPYSTATIGSVDVGLCEISGLTTPPDVLGVCCTCSAGGPGVCAENFTQKDCVELLRGVFVPCADCSDPAATCPGIPGNDDIETPFLISNVPTDGTELVIENQNNICATDDGPGLQSGQGGCALSLPGDADMHDDIWYCYTPDECGELTVHSCGDTDSMDQMIAIYDGSGGLPLLRTNEIGCGDDTCGPQAGPSTVTVLVEAGTKYYIRVGGWNVEVPGGFFGSPRGTWNLHLALDANCPDVIEPELACNTDSGRGSRNGHCAEGEEPIQKNRYISVNVRGENDTNPPTLKVKVTMTASLAPGADGVGIALFAGAPDADCISVVGESDQGFVDWSGCATVHLTGCAIIPTSTYDITVTDDQGTESPALSADTQAKPGIKWHSDCVGAFDGERWSGPNGQTNIDDAVAAIKTFQQPTFLPGCATPPCNATHTSVTDVAPNLVPAVPNKIVNIEDVLIIILGFGGQEYPGADTDGCD